MTYEGHTPPTEPTTEGILNDMLGQAIGMDAPMTGEAISEGTEIVQARMDRASEIVRGDPLRPGEEYDSEAVAALFLMQHEAAPEES